MLMDEILPYKLENTLLLVTIIFAVISVTKVIVSFIRQWMMIYLSQQQELST